MRKIRDRVWSGLLAILVILSLVPQPIFAESDPSLEIVAEYWGETESTFTIRCTDAANTTQITVLAAVYQKGAFTAVDDGQINAAMYASSRRAARDALNGWDPTGGAIYYYNPRTATNQWIRTR